MIIDGTNLRLGRMATIVAKKALLGETIDIVNVDKVLITGKKDRIKKDFFRGRDMGIPSKGPYHSRVPFKVVKRAIRGMLPYKQPKGRAAFERIKCHSGIPAVFKDKELQSIETAHINSSNTSQFLTIGEICKFLGGSDE